jgi:predicted secreted protein
MDSVTLTVGETFAVVLPQRGSSGFSLLHRESAEGLLAIDGPLAVESQRGAPGDPVDRRFVLRALQPGIVRILFYETRIWDKGFSPLPVRELEVTVISPT